jgi:hypothetical protein
VGRGIKVAVWLGVFALCAGAGAYVAAHTNPFPPGVEDPGARSITPTSASPAALPRWTGTMRSSTEHVFHVGGRCATDWIATFAFRIDAAGNVRGSGNARLHGEPRCDFPVAQVQTVALGLRVTGAEEGSQVRLGFARVGTADPLGSQDLGGFTMTLAGMQPAIRTDVPPRTWTFVVRRPDGDLGTYGSRNQLIARCVRSC